MLSSSLLLYCIGVKGQAYRDILKQHLIAKAEQRMPDYSLLVDFCFVLTKNLINAMEFTPPHPCVNDYFVYTPTNYDTTMNNLM